MLKKMYGILYDKYTEWKTGKPPKTKARGQVVQVR